MRGVGEGKSCCSKSLRGQKADANIGEKFDFLAGIVSQASAKSTWSMLLIGSHKLVEKVSLATKTKLW